MRSQITNNFESNLEAIESFWSENGFLQAYDKLLDDLSETLVPNLETYPQLGRPFLSLEANSVEGSFKRDKIKKILKKSHKNGDIRQYVMDDYLVLYALFDEVIYLLSIRHHKQVSFDFAHLWAL